MTPIDEDTTHREDTAAIRAIFEQLATSWNDGDGTAYGSLFTDDADYIDVTGRHTKGGQAIGAYHQFLFDGPLKGSRLETGELGTLREDSFPADNVAIVIGGGTSQLEGDATPQTDRDSINTTILVKRGGTWRIRAFQNNRVMPFPGGK